MYEEFSERRRQSKFNLHQFQMENVEQRIYNMYI